MQPSLLQIPQDGGNVAIPETEILAPTPLRPANPPIPSSKGPSILDTSVENEESIETAENETVTVAPQKRKRAAAKAEQPAKAMKTRAQTSRKKSPPAKESDGSDDDFVINIDSDEQEGEEPEPEPSPPARKPARKKPAPRTKATPRKKDAEGNVVPTCQRQMELRTLM